MCSGLLMASQTRCRGASNRRVIVMARSEGIVIAKVSLFAARLAGMFHLLAGFEGFQVAVEAVEPLLPERAVPLGERRHVLQRPRLEPARPPLRFAAARHEPGAFE